jgi:RNA polymerase sigma-70 factor (ECF subfamily)
LFRVARHTLYDHYHAQPNFTETVLDEWIAVPVDDQPEAQFIRSMHIETARRAIHQLTVDQQEVLILRFGQMLSLQETADIMGKKANAVKQLQLRALDALRRVLHQMEASYD